MGLLKIVVVAGAMILVVSARAQDAAAPAPVPAAAAAPEAPAAPAPGAAPSLGLPGTTPPAFATPPEDYRTSDPLLPPGEKPKISNYFLYLKKAVDEELAKKPRPPKGPGENLTAPRSFAFDVVDGLSSKEVVRAAREGARFARDKNPNATPEELDRLIEENVRFALEYYPLVAVDPDAMNNLYYLMEDARAEPALRRFLYSVAVPGRANDCLFARFLQDAMVMDSERAVKIFSETLASDLEQPDMRILALEDLYQLRLNEFAAFLAKDPNAPDFVVAHQRGPQAKDLAAGDGFKPSDRSNSGIKNSRTIMADLAKSYATLLAPTNPAPQTVRDAVVRILKRMPEEAYLEDPALIDMLLAGAAPAKKQAPAATDDGGLAF